MSLTGTGPRLWAATDRTRAIALRDRRIDPYLLWNDAIGFRSFGLRAGEKLVVQIELAAPFKDQLAQLPGVEVPPVYSVPIGSGTTTSRFVTARVDAKWIWTLMMQKGVRRVQLELAHLPPLSAPAHQPDQITRPAGHATLGHSATPAPSRTWLGVIDDGCPFAHERLRDPAGASRVRLLWDPAARAGAPGAGVLPARLGYGREYRPDRAGPIQGADEQAHYAAFDMPDFPVRRATHGCGVLDLLAGQPNPLPMQFEAGAHATDRAGMLPVAGVLLPKDALDEGCRTGFGVRVLDALRYLVDAVERYHQANGSRDPTVRLVVNLSYGSLAGPHDGSSILESAMDELIHERGNLAIVLAAGNTIDPVRPTHALMVSDGKAIQPRLAWQIQPDDRTDSFVEIWFDADVDLDRVALRVTAPGGATHAVRVGDAMALKRCGTVVAGVVFARRSALGTSGTMALIALIAADPIDGAPGAPGGTWTIDLDYRGAKGSVHAWIERDDLVPGQGRRRQQSWFDGLSAEAEPLRYTLSSIAHGRYTTVVGGMRLADGSVPSYSASGPSRNRRGRQGPDISAPSDRGRVTTGLRVAGTLTGISQVFSGTSAAAPIAARWIANWFARQPPGHLDVQQLRTYLKSKALARLEPSVDPRRMSRVSFGAGGSNPPRRQRIVNGG